MASSKNWCREQPYNIFLWSTAIKSIGMMVLALQKAKMCFRIELLNFKIFENC